MFDWCVWILLALLLAQVAYRSATFATVLSKPVPTAGAEAGNNFVSGLPADPPVFASDSNRPHPMIVAEVPEPTERTVSIISRYQDTFVVTAVTRVNAWL